MILIIIFPHKFIKTSYPQKVCNVSRQLYLVPFATVALLKFNRNRFKYRTLWFYKDTGPTEHVISSTNLVPYMNRIKKIRKIEINVEIYLLRPVA